MRKVKERYKISNFFIFRCLMQLFTVLLTVSILFIGLVYFAPTTAQAARINYAPSRLGDVPDVTCLDLTFSNVTGQSTVAAQNPPGGMLRYTLTLYVTNQYAKNHRVSNIVVTAKITGSCTNGSFSADSIQFNGPYTIYPGAGYGQPNDRTGRCIVTANGVPSQTVVPSSISAEIRASGSYIDGQTGQIAVANIVEITIW